MGGSGCDRDALGCWLACCFSPFICAPGRVWGAYGVGGWRNRMRWGVGGVKSFFGRGQSEIKTVVQPSPRPQPCFNANAAARGARPMTGRR